MIYSAYGADNGSTFLRFGRLGNPLSDVRPALTILSDTRFLNSSVNPDICAVSQLSKFNFLTYQSAQQILSEQFAYDSYTTG